MKKSLLLALATILVFPSLASAVSDENVTKRRPDAPAKLEIQEIRQDIRNNIAKNHAERLQNRFTFYGDRLGNIITRFQLRLDTLKANGKNTTATQVKLDLAKSKLAEAKLKGETSIAAFTALESSNLKEQKAEFLAARDLANSARKLFEETHTVLKEALRELKTISKPALPASSAAVENAN